MGTGKQHPVPAVQSIGISPERTKTCQIDCRILHSLIRGNDGPSGVCQQPIRASCLSRNLRRWTIRREFSARLSNKVGVGAIAAVWVWSTKPDPALRLQLFAD